MGAVDSTPLHILVKSKSARCRFWSKVRVYRDDACWHWREGIGGDGYGKFWWAGRTIRAHRAAWMIEHGEIPKGLVVCHKCDNPLCCNPAHLFVGTQADNIADKVSKGRVARGEAHGNSKLTRNQVEEIRGIYGGGGVTQAELAERFGVTPPLIGYIVRGEIWQHALNGADDGARVEVR